MSCVSGSFGPFQAVVSGSACLGNKIVAASSAQCTPCVPAAPSASQVNLATGFNAAPVTIPAGTDISALEAQLVATQQSAILATVQSLVASAFPSCSSSRLLAVGPTTVRKPVAIVKQITATARCCGGRLLAVSTGAQYTISFNVVFTVDFGGCAVPNIATAVSAVTVASTSSNTTRSLTNLASSVAATTGIPVTGAAVGTVAQAPTPSQTPSASRSATSSPSAQPACPIDLGVAVPALTSTCSGSGFYCVRSSAQSSAIAARQVRYAIVSAFCFHFI